MGLIISKEGEKKYLELSDTTRISKDGLAEFLGCDPELVNRAAELAHVRAGMGPHTDPELPPVTQYQVGDIPQILQGLKTLSVNRNLHPPHKLPEDPQLAWAKELDPSQNFEAKTPAGYTIIYQYEPKELKPAA